MASQDLQHEMAASSSSKERSPTDEELRDMVHTLLHEDPKMTARSIRNELIERRWKVGKKRISRWMGLPCSLPITKTNCTNCSSSSLHETPSAASFQGIAGWKGVRVLLREGEQQEIHQPPGRQDKRGKGKSKAARKWRGHILIKFSGTKRRSATCIEGLSRGDIISLMKTLPPSLLELHIGKDGPVFSVCSGLSPPARSTGGDSLDALAQEVLCALSESLMKSNGTLRRLSVGLTVNARGARSLAMVIASTRAPQEIRFLYGALGNDTMVSMLDAVSRSVRVQVVTFEGNGPSAGFEVEQLVQSDQTRSRGMPGSCRGSGRQDRADGERLGGGGMLPAASGSELSVRSARLEGAFNAKASDEDLLKPLRPSPCSTAEDLAILEISQEMSSAGVSVLQSESSHRQEVLSSDDSCCDDNIEEVSGQSGVCGALLRLLGNAGPFLREVHFNRWLDCACQSEAEAVMIACKGRAERDRAAAHQIYLRTMTAESACSEVGRDFGVTSEVLARDGSQGCGTGSENVFTGMVKMYPRAQDQRATDSKNASTYGVTTEENVQRKGTGSGHTFTRGVLADRGSTVGLLVTTMYGSLTPPLPVVLPEARLDHPYDIEFTLEEGMLAVAGAAHARLGGRCSLRVLGCDMLEKICSGAFGRRCVRVPADFSTVNAAVLACKKGGRVRISPGTHSVSVLNVHDCIEIVGEKGVTLIGDIHLGGDETRFGTSNWNVGILQGIEIIGRLSLSYARWEVIECTIVAAEGRGLPLWMHSGVLFMRSCKLVGEGKKMLARVCAGQFTAEGCTFVREEVDSDGISAAFEIEADVSKPSSVVLCFDRAFAVL